MELLPCPFCNELKELEVSESFVLCHSCLCQALHSKWNTRHSPWISVEEKLPYENGYYLVSRDLSKHKAKIKVTIRQFHEHTKGSRKRFWHSGGEDMSITHWMPLPTPPETK